MVAGRAVASDQFQLQVPAQGGHKFGVEYMVVQAAVFVVFEAALAEGFGRGRTGVPRAVVQSQNFGQVRKVVFADAVAGTYDHAVQQGGPRKLVPELVALLAGR